MGLEDFFVHTGCNKIHKQAASIPSAVLCSLMVHSAVLGKLAACGGFCFFLWQYKLVISLESWNVPVLLWVLGCLFCFAFL